MNHLWRIWCWYTARHDFGMPYVEDDKLLHKCQRCGYSDYVLSMRVGKR